MSLFSDASLAMIPSAYKDGKLYSIKPTDGSGDFTFSRGSNLAATRVDVNGLIEKGRENLLLQSNQFDNSYWNKTASTISTGQADPNGGFNAFKIIEDTSTNYHRIFGSYTMVSGNVYATSVTAKAAGRNFITLSNNVSSGTCIFNLTNGSITTQESNVISASTTSLGGGWYRCEMIAQGDKSGSYNVYIGADNNGIVGTYLGDGTSGVLIYQSQLELGLVATDYIETTTTTAVSGITEDLPRLDYSGGASCPSLLLEPTRTNLITQSEYFGSSDWTKTRASVTDNAATSPDGYTNADKLVEDTTASNNHFLQLGFITVTATNYTATIYAKAAERSQVRILLSNYWATGNDAIYDLSAGTVLSVGAGAVSASITDVGNGWYRCALVSGTATAGPNGKFDVRPAVAGSDTYTGDGTSGIYIWGAQLEEGSYPSSYIPTYGSAVTRLVDVSYVSSATSLIGQTQGTLFVEGRIDGQESYNRRLLTISDGGTANKIEIFNPSNSLKIRTVGTVSTVTQFDIESGSILTIGDTFKVAVAYAQNDFVMYINGTQIGTDSSGNIPTTNKINLGRGDNNFNAESPINQALLFKTRLTNGELAALTTL